MHTIPWVAGVDWLRGIQEIQHKPLAVDSELEASLAKEPTDDEELAAKFKIFETILATVTTIREQVLAFWEENKDQFSGIPRKICKH